MKYKIETIIIIDNPNYGALGDDFSFKEIEALDVILEKIEKVILEQSEMEIIYGNMCYQINISKETSSIFCYEEFLGEEPTVEIYDMFKKYKKAIEVIDSEG